MITFVKDTLWSQFGASIDMLRNAITSCPEPVWNRNDRFFYVSYHVLIFLDYYLNIPPKELSSPLPFTMAKEGADFGEAVDDLVPNRRYSKQELLDYLDASRLRCKTILSQLTEEKLQEPWNEISGNKKLTVMSLLLYNMRHVQHHTAQLNMMLRQETGAAAPRWVRSANDQLSNTK